MHIRTLLVYICVSCFINIVPARSYEIDIHHAATFAIALAVGFDWDEANLVANANQAVDENTETWPSESVAMGVLRDVDQVSQFKFTNLVIGLSPQDHYLL
jgi:hypothetical protein